LLVWGLNAEGSFGSEVSKTFTGHPTDRAMWLIIGGAASGLTGLGMLLFTGRHGGGNRLRRAADHQQSHREHREEFRTVFGTEENLGGLPVSVVKES